jgi:hypothetical protein
MTDARGWWSRWTRGDQAAGGNVNGLARGVRRDSPFVWRKRRGGRWIRLVKGVLERPRREVIRAFCCRLEGTSYVVLGSCTQHVRASKRGVGSLIASRVVEFLGGTERTARTNARVMERSSLVRLVAGEGLRTRARPSSKHSSRWVSRRGRHGLLAVDWQRLAIFGSRATRLDARQRCETPVLHPRSSAPRFRSWDASPAAPVGWSGMRAIGRLRLSTLMGLLVDSSMGLFVIRS